MKKIFFLLLLPTFAVAQYTGNANQKITLGEQTTADGLVYRGIAADTTLTVKSDTAAYFVLDTVNLNLYTYKASASGRKWRQLGADTAAIAYVNTYGTQTINGAKSFSTAPTFSTALSGSSGGTGATTFGAANRIPYASSTTALTTSSGLTFDGTNFNTTGTATATKFIPTGTSATGNGMYLPATNTLGFSVNGTQAMNLNSSGNLGVGTSFTPSGRLGVKSSGTNRDVFNVVYSSSDYDMFQIYEYSSGNAEINLRASSGTPKFRLSTDGASFFLGGSVGIGTTTPQSGYKLHVVDSVYVGGNVSASAYTTRSDYDLKDEIQNLTYGIDEVMQMQPVKYTYKSNGSTQLGFIAQDLGVITPEVVSFEDKMSVYYNALIPILTKAIQEQQAQIEALKQRLLILENK